MCDYSNWYKVVSHGIELFRKGQRNKVKKYNLFHLEMHHNCRHTQNAITYFMFATHCLKAV